MNGHARIRLGQSVPIKEQSSLLMFADDIKICRAVSGNVNEDLQRDLDKLMNWTDQWSLRLNPDKCKVMHVNHSLDTNYILTEQNAR